MKIILDAMGGDNAPRAAVEGAFLAAKEFGTEVVLVGREDTILETVHTLGVQTLPPGVTIQNASEVVEVADNPATAFRDKKDSSLTVALTLLRDGGGDAVVSAGSTGALLSAATLLVKRVRGIRRAAMAPLIPTAGGKLVLIDCGANAECTPEYLVQFAFMGNYYARRALGLDAPRVGLLNIGAEPEKGTPLQQETYTLLKEAGDAGRIRFVGNVEARDALLGAVDVLVTDGFSGNIFLKAVEGTGLFLAGEVKKLFLKNVATKLSAFAMKSGLAAFKKLLDYREVGGTAFLGITKPVVKAHGSSDAYAFRSAIRQAAELAGSGLMEDIAASVGLMRPGTDEKNH
ncbi:MAG TPA: phosphate acyltransferase PlsX [Oscillospiraceae bacterium]|nr:phosphate acyltransferase PlsX [Oscillospiraceae bacterium]